jgi:hypothetical protein
MEDNISMGVIARFRMLPRLIRNMDETGTSEVRIMRMTRMGTMDIRPSGTRRIVSEVVTPEMVVVVVGRNIVERRQEEENRPANVPSGRLPLNQAVPHMCLMLDLPSFMKPQVTFSMIPKPSYTLATRSKCISSMFPGSILPTSNSFQNKITNPHPPCLDRRRLENYQQKQS